MKKKKETTKKIIKKHRHKWEQCMSDCPRCGTEEYFECECGELRDFNMKKYIY